MNMKTYLRARSFRKPTQLYCTTPDADIGMSQEAVDDNFDDKQDEFDFDKAVRAGEVLEGECKGSPLYRAESGELIVDYQGQGIWFEYPGLQSEVVKMLNKLKGEK